MRLADDAFPPLPMTTRRQLHDRLWPQEGTFYLDAAELRYLRTLIGCDLVKRRRRSSFTRALRRRAVR